MWQRKHITLSEPIKRAGDFFPPLILSLPIFHVWFQSLLPQSNKCLEIFKWVSAPEHTWTGKSRAWDPPSPQTPKSQGPCIHDFNNFSLLHRLCITSDYLMISVHVQTHSKSNSIRGFGIFVQFFFFPPNVSCDLLGSILSAPLCLWLPVAP